MKKFLFTTLAVGALAVSAGAACTETVSIGTKDQLNAFRDRVNNGAASLCAVLTADISYNNDVVNSTNSGVNSGSFDSWIPIGKDDGHVFQGSFDGMNHTISGLYINGSVQYDAGLFGIAKEGAVIKNVRVEDSYFKASTSGNGGILGKAYQGAVLIDNCSFDGLIEGTNNGGIVGSVQDNGKLAITNSYNEGNIKGSDAGGLVGVILKNSKATLALDNCYNTGSGATNPLVGKNNAGTTISAKDVGCVSTKSGVFSSEKCDDVVKNNVTIANASILETNYLNNKNGSAATINAWNLQTMDQKVETLNNQLEQEINVEKVQIKENWFTKVTVSKTNVSDAAPFAIKQDVVTDIITFDREYESGVASTIIVPFDCGVSGISNAKFYEFASVEKVDGAWKVRAKQVSMLNAHTPYFVMPTESGKLTFENGPYVLKANVDAEGETKSYEKSIGNTAWKAVGVYTKKRWDVGVNEEEIGTIYGFAAQAKSEKNPGDFVRGGKKVAILPLRSYLKYDASTDEETVVSAPALTKMRAISSTEVASIDALPQSLSVELEDAPERVEIIESIEVPEGEETQEDEDLGEKPQGIAQSLMIRLDAQKADRWFNINGRNMKNKPKSQGAFIKNSTPVIIK